MRIAFGINMVGGANAVLPVAAEALKNGDEIAVYADKNGSVFEKFSPQWPIISSVLPVDKFYDWFKPDLVVASAVCVNSGLVNRVLMGEAKHRGFKTVLVEDFWGEHNVIKWRDGLYPDLICVQDEFAKGLVRDSWPWPLYSQDRIKVTGQPGLDYLSKVDCQEAKKSLREKFGLRDNHKSIVYFSGFVAGMEEALAMTVEAFNVIGRPIYFFLRHHPKILANNAPEEHRKIYQQCKLILKKLKNDRIQVVDSYWLASTEEVLSGSDMVIGSSDSISLIEACHLHIPCIAVKTKLREEILLRDTGNLLRSFPPCALGACLEAANTVELVVCLEGTFGGAFLPKLKFAQEQNFKNDGLSAQRVYKAISFLF